MTELDQDIRIIYLAAGHTESGGTQGQGMSEGRENIQTVNDALGYLCEHAGLAGPNATEDDYWEYDLGDTLLVVIDHSLDLVPTIRAINADYTRRCTEWGLDPHDWRHGICIETHFNAPSKTAKGPMVIHTQNTASKQLGNLAAEVLEGVIGLSARHWYNEWKTWPGGSVGYGFINETYPLALIVEMDEQHNPERARIIRDPQADDIYGLAMARLLMRLAGVTEQVEPPAPSLAERVEHLELAVIGLQEQLGLLRSLVHRMEQGWRIEEADGEVSE